jgi:hypothetical protein
MTLESLVKRDSKPNKKITTASQLLPVHGLLSNVFGKRGETGRWTEMTGRPGKSGGGKGKKYAVPKCRAVIPLTQQTCKREWVQIKKSLT